MEKRLQPDWQPPKDDSPKLKLYNSLTRKKELFQPQSGNKVLWYSCGPTVYDAAHMGHARSYISFDILRRILSSYFSYNVYYVMNITDIDDKIIKRARQNYLFEEYLSKPKELSQVNEDVERAIKNYELKMNETKDADKLDMMLKQLNEAKSAKLLIENSLSASSDKIDLANLVNPLKDILSEDLDKHYGADVSDNSIFSALPAKWENEFNKDMEHLNILPPDVVTRVSEYIPEIIEYVEKIIENGFAYDSNGSVYFDTAKFDENANHHYGKLVPEAIGDLKQLHEGEGDLSISEDRLKEKKNVSDFALWKASKPGEPSWESPWGKGRPGWHIECSVMASHVLGEKLDIHTGGVDLKFPHHDNELAQAEAYFGNNQWVNYFLHSGHLTISGCKMSKSLKNFITIKDSLKHYSARQLRFIFLLHSWKDTLDFSADTLNMAVHYERLVMEFYLNLQNLIRKFKNQSSLKYDPAEIILMRVFKEKEDNVHKALCDNIDTRTALEHIRDLISASNSYIKERNSNNIICNIEILSNIWAYISRMLKIFGISTDFSSNQSNNNLEVKNKEEIVIPYLEVLAKFREDIRKTTTEYKELKDLKRELFKLCDSLRDDVLPELGVRLEDIKGQLPDIKLVDPEELRKEKERKELEKEKKQKEKEMNASKKSRKNNSKIHLAKHNNEQKPTEQLQQKIIDDETDSLNKISKITMDT